MTAALLHACAARAKAQLAAGIRELHDGNTLAGLVYFAAAQATLQNLEALLDSPPPLRKIALARKPEGPDEAA